MSSSLMNYSLINNNFDFKEKILAFDMDYTIIKPKSNKRLPVNKDDWKFIFNANEIIKKKSKKHSIVIITNQLGVSKGKTNLEDIQDKIKNIFSDLDINGLAIISTNKDNIRKPRIGSFKIIEDMYHQNNKKIKQFYYIGDAAGREKDHSDSDYKYLLNIKKYTNIKTKFYTPEEFFLKEEKQAKNISGYKLNYNGINTIDDIIKKVDNLISDKYVLLIVGYPASGKSTLAKLLSKHYNINHLSKDIFGGKFNKMVKENISTNQNFIVEGLYYSNKQRNELKKLITNDYQIINILIDTDIETAKHLNIYRSLNNDENEIPTVVYNTYRKRFENFTDVLKVKPILLNPNINKYYLA